MVTVRGLIGILIVLLSTAAMAQNAAWRDSARAAMNRTHSQKAYYNMAESYANAGIPDSSIAILNRGLLMVRDGNWERSMHMALGWLYAGKGLHSVAEQELLSALNISLEASDSVTASRCCIIIGDIAELDGLNDKAVEYKQRALKYHQDSYGQFSYAISLMHAGNGRMLKLFSVNAGIRTLQKSTSPRRGISSQNVSCTLLKLTVQNAMHSVFCN